MYPEELVKPMRADLASAGFEELYTSEAVENALKQEGTTLVVVNSVWRVCRSKCQTCSKIKPAKQQKTRPFSNGFCWS